jgi:hypothetical protein
MGFFSSESVLNILKRYEHESRPDVRPRGACQLLEHLLIYFAGPSLGMLAAAEVFLLAREGDGPYCAKLHHHNDKRCIFRHWGQDPTTPPR